MSTAPTGLTDYTHYTVDELVEASGRLDEQVDGLFDRLGRITATAASGEHGIEVTVNLEGRLIGLELGADALALGPQRLAAELSALVGAATRKAISEGMAMLAPVAGAELTTELTRLVGLVDEPAAQPGVPAALSLSAVVEPAPPADRAPLDEPAPPAAGTAGTVDTAGTVGTVSAAEPAATESAGTAARPVGRQRRPRPAEDEDFSTIQTWAVSP